MPQEDPGLGTAPPRFNKVRETMAGLQLLELVVPSRGSSEDRTQYLKRVWPKIKNNITSTEEVKRLWLSKETGNKVNDQESAQTHYDRMVPDIEIDYEETLAQRSQESLNEGQALATVWHNILSEVPSSRALPVLKKVMKGKREEARFRVMRVEETTIWEINRAIRQWDVEECLANEKRRKRDSERQKKEDPPQNQQMCWRGSQQKGQDKSGPKPSQSQGPPNPSYQGKQDQQAGNPPRDGQQNQGGPRRPAYVPPEEYNKLSNEQKDALRAAREIANRGGPGK